MSLFKCWHCSMMNLFNCNEWQSALVKAEVCNVFFVLNYFKIFNMQI